MGATGTVSTVQAVLQLPMALSLAAQDRSEIQPTVVPQLAIRIAITLVVEAKSASTTPVIPEGQAQASSSTSRFSFSGLTITSWPLFNLKYLAKGAGIRTTSELPDFATLTFEARPQRPSSFA